MNAQTRLGMFVLIALILLALMSSKVGRFDWVEKKEGSMIEALFDDASGIVVQTPVLMAGVKVGKVTNISLEDNQALVHIQINSGIQLPTSTMASIAGGGLVGEKHLALNAQPGDNSILPPNARIKVEQTGSLNQVMRRTVNVADDLQAFMVKAGKIADSLNGILDENRQHLRSATKGLDESSTSLSHTLRVHEKDISRLLKSLPKTSETGQAFFAQANAATQDMRDLMRDNRENLFRAIFELRKAAENMESLSADLKRNPWKLMKEKDEVPPSKKKQQAKMEEMLLMTDQMGLNPARP